MSATEFEADRLCVRVFDQAGAVARAAATDAVAAVVDALAHGPRAGIMFAAGTSQLRFLDELAARGIDWSKATGFHMDEYVGIGPEHPASFQRYMRERVADRLGITTFHYIAGAATDADAEAARYAGLLAAHSLDLCCLGIGENGHLAFNDPPVADFDDPVDAKVVELDDASRRQQVGEGHFADLADVPPRAITVTIPALLRTRRVLAIVPDARKAEPVRRALEGPVSTDCPASVLHRHPDAVLYLDRESASLLGRTT